MQPFSFFISYRRRDTGPIALLLKHELEKRLQFVRVFLDVEDIMVGQAFPDRIRDVINQADATIALIGPTWMPRKDGTGDARADDVDWVVEELRHSMTQNAAGRVRAIIPIFVDCDRRFDQFQLAPALAELSLKHAEQISYAHWPRSIGPLIQSVAESLKLSERPQGDSYPTPDPGIARTQPVADKELALLLTYDAYAGWYLDNFGETDVRYMAKKFEFTSFEKAARFMELVSQHCRVLDHHPEWRNVYKSVSVALTTWDAKRQVTFYDLALALYMNKAAQAVAKGAV